MWAPLSWPHLNLSTYPNALPIKIIISYEGFSILILGECIHFMTLYIYIYESISSIHHLSSIPRPTYFCHFGLIFPSLYLPLIFSTKWPWIIMLIFYLHLLDSEIRILSLYYAKLISVTVTDLHTAKQNLQISTFILIEHTEAFDTIYSLLLEPHFLLL